MKIWSPERPVIELPSPLHSIFSEEASILLDELQNHRLCVVLVPAPEQNFSSQMIRSVEERNPKWYSKLWEEHKWMERRRICPALERIAKLQDKPFDYVHYWYDTICRKLIKERLVEGYKTYEGEQICANNEVINYFKNPKKYIANLEQKIDDVPF